MEKVPQAKIRLMNLNLNNKLISKVSEIISFGNGTIGLFNALGLVPILQLHNLNVWEFKTGGRILYKVSQFCTIYITFLPNAECWRALSLGFV